MNEIVVVGSLNVDIALRATRIPQPGETVRAEEITIGPGGKGLNQSIAAAKLGAGVRLVGRVGDDAFAEVVQRALADAGVDTRYVEVEVGGHTGTAAIIVDRDSGQNAITVAGGANRALSVAQVEGAVQAFEGARVLLVQLEAPLETVSAALELARRQGLTTVLDPAPARELNPALLQRVDILTPNESEASFLTGQPVEDVESAEIAGKKLRELTQGDVIVTLGERGCVWVSSAGVEHFPAPAVRAVDTTGAGDAFNGALACGLANGESRRESIAFAITAGSVSTLRSGAAESTPSRDQLREFASS